VGSGQSLIRLLQFSGLLFKPDDGKTNLSWWSDLIQQYFTPKAVMRFTLWKDNQRNEAKPFEIGVPILPRFFLVTTQSGVKSMTLSLDGARERMYAPNHAVVECVEANWTYRYANGYTIALRGPLTAHVKVSPGPPGSSTPNAQPNLQFEELQFEAKQYDKWISIDSIHGKRTSPVARNMLTPTSNGIINTQDEDKKWEEPRISVEDCQLPGEPVNAFGIPQATMRCLEVWEVLIQHCGS
ncbi:hypothetical protein BDN72DRAFT_774009, partial [Pluteus cervinus]